MIEVNITATNFTVVSSSTIQNYTITSTNVIFTITNTVSPNITIINTSTNLVFSADGSANSDPVFKTVTANTGTFNKLIANDIKTVTFTATTGTFTSLTTQNFNLNGLQYPSSKGSYGQVLFTNGTSFANWVNLGDLVFWSLSNDLLTNGYNIVSGSNSTQLKVGVGIANATPKTYIQLANSEIRLVTDGADPYSHTPLIADNNGVTVKGRSWLQGPVWGVSYPFPNSPQLDYLEVGKGIKFPDGSVMTSEYIPNYPLASRSVFGVVKIGENIQVNDGVISVTTSSLYTLPAATTSIRGGIRVGYGLYAGNSDPFQPQDQLNLGAATASVRGGVRLGTGLTVTDGDVINAAVSTSTVFGNISLTQDAYLNTYRIRNDPSGQQYFGIQPGLGGASNIKMGTNTKGFSLYQIGDSSRIDIVGGEIYATGSLFNVAVDTISLDAGGDINISTPTRTRIGNGTTSTLYVQKIYNYAGTYAPTFPAGVQFADNSVQVTAWQPNTLYQQYVDFQNPTDP